MCAAIGVTPSLMSAGIRSAASMMYAAVVGMPMPRMIAAAMVMTRRAGASRPEKPTRKLVNRMRQPGLQHDADHDSRRGAGHRHRHRLLRAVAQGVEAIAPAQPCRRDAARRADQRDRGDDRGVGRREALSSRKKTMTGRNRCPCRSMMWPRSGSSSRGMPMQAAAHRVEVDRREQSAVVEQRRDHGGQHDGA